MLSCNKVQLFLNKYQGLDFGLHGIVNIEEGNQLPSGADARRCLSEGPNYIKLTVTMVALKH
jgi:hypothetical protein